MCFFRCFPLIYFDESLYFLAIASRNISDWWLSYWISNTQDGYPGNITVPSLNITPPNHHGGGGTPPMVPVVSGSDNLAFYLGIYGGLALSNSVSFMYFYFIFFNLFFFVDLRYLLCSELFFMHMEGL